jgi:hypothetical protein
MRAMLVFLVGYKKKRRTQWARRRMIVVGLGLPRPNTTAGLLLELDEEPEKSERNKKKGTDRDGLDHSITR